MNHYSQTLEALKAQPDHELKQVGDQWQTPKAIAWGLFHTFAPKIGPVVIDVFADECNHLVANYYTAADNALMQDLAGDCRRLGGAAYGNPPYSIPKQDDNGNPLTGMENILNWCREQRDAGAKIMLLIKAATSDGWWPEDADFIQFIAGRIAFEVPAWYKPRDPKKDKPTASGFASAVMIWDKEWKWERRPVERLNRDDLITTGNILLGMIEQRASELAQQYVGSTIEQRPDDAEPGEQIAGFSDAGKLVGTHIDEGAKVCTSEVNESDTQQSLTAATEEQAEQIATKCVEQSGADIDGGTKALTIPTVEYTSEQIAEQPEATETTEEQTDLFEHFDEAMAAGTEPVPKQEAEPTPAVITSKTGKVKSDDAEVFFDQLQIPQNVRAISAKCPDTGISRNGYAIWAKGYFSAGKINGIGIRSTGDFKKGYFYEPTLVVFHQGKDVGEYTNWPEALAALDALLQPDPEAEPQGEAHPFFTGFYGGHATYAPTVPDKVAKVKTFTLEQCQAALKLPHLQSTVLAAVEARIRKLQKEQAA